MKDELLGILDALICLAAILTLSLCNWGKYVLWFFIGYMALGLVYIIVFSIVIVFKATFEDKYRPNVCYNGKLYRLLGKMQIIPYQPHNIFSYNIVHYDEKGVIVEVDRYDKPDKFRYRLARYNEQHNIIETVENVPQRLLKSITE